MKILKISRTKVLFRERLDKFESTFPDRIYIADTRRWHCSPPRGRVATGLFIIIARAGAGLGRLGRPCLGCRDVITEVGPIIEN